ncbi:MAG: exodeoxyribonuclease V subunit gamma, partial [Lentisphaeria bacterium]|nr:exodeoxyribonuclease V subunit gamma [Lentisphaeria bacterium]
MEPFFHLYSGNDPEQLAVLLAQLLQKTPPQDPFAAQEIIVQSKGMAAYLNQQLARHTGCVCNTRYPFLNRAVEEILHTALPETMMRDLDFFRPEVLKFAILEELLHLTDDSGKDGVLHPFARYLEGSRREERARQLAEVLAVRFEQYQIYRPEMMLRGNLPDPAQQELWRRISAGKIIRPALFHSFFQQEGSPALQAKYPQLILFGIGALPPLYFWFFRKVSEFLPVHFFYQTPCRGEWSERSAHQDWMTVHDPPEEDGEEDLLSGNPLLSSWGKAGRDFFNTILEATDYDPDAPEAVFRDPGSETLLHALQQDILENRCRREPEPDGTAMLPPPVIPPEDASLQIHNCHHPMREVEVLHDELLHFFAEDPSRKAGDILVMAPDIGRYEPYIRAVFQHSGSKTIPFSIGDRPEEAEQELQNAFFSLASLLKGRMALPDILEFFESPAVHSHFGIPDDQMPELRSMLAESRTSWGIDEAHRKQCLNGESSFSGGTLQELQDRLLLGMAMMPEEDGSMIPFAGLLPMQLLSGERMKLAKAWEQFMALLSHFARRSATPHPVEEWRSLMQEMLEKLFTSRRPFAQAVQNLRSAIDAAAENAARARITLPLELETVFAETEGVLAGKSAMSANGFLRGAVTFCTMRPMRNVPHRMICLLGMSENAYPRRENQTGLDLIWHHPCRGDRSIRTEDRFLFLEALLAARERLRIFYCGQDPGNNTPAPPSALVSELQQYLENNYTLPRDGKSWLRHRREMLHNYHPCYFRGGERATFSRSAGRIASFLASAELQMPSARFPETELLSAESAEPLQEEEISLQEMHRFFCNPFAYFAREILQIRDPGYPESDPPGEEPQTLRLNGEWDLQKKLILAALSGNPAEQRSIRERAQLSGVLPVEPFGTWSFQEALRSQEEVFCKKIKALNDLSLREWWQDAEPVILPPDLQQKQLLAAARRQGMTALLFSGKYSARNLIAGMLLQLFRGEPEPYWFCFSDKIVQQPAMD